MSDIHDDLEEAIARMYSARRTDCLTGLGNYTGLADALSLGVPQTVILFDVSNFKNVNETVGHFEADKMLRRIAESIRVFSGRGDDIYRHGGDEFAILLDGCSAADAFSVMARIELNYGSQIVGGKRVRLVGACGVARNMDDLNQIDKRLEARKREERN